MASFTELLTASDDELVRIFYKTGAGDETDFIKRINIIARKLDLNHSQLVCALGFNRHIRDLTDIQQQLGFRSYRLLTLRQNELFTTDTYKYLGIDNILDIYAERLEDREILENLRELLIPRLTHIETSIDQNEDPGHITSYRMEVRAIYTSGIADATFAGQRLQMQNGRLRHMANEAMLVIDAGYETAGNLFFMDTLSAEEKQAMIEAGHINEHMIRNRLQNRQISEQERQMLEEHL